MASPNSDEPPHKRQKLSPSPHCKNTTEIFTPEDCSSEEAMLKALKSASKDLESQLEREAEVGILHFVNLNNLGFSGILKQRYTDFIVNEITPRGKVVHLTDVPYPQGVDTGKDLSPSKTTRERRSSHKATEENENPVSAVLPVSRQDVPTDVVSSNDSTAEYFLSSEDTALLDSYFDAQIRHSMTEMFQKILQHPNAKPTSFGTIYSQPITDRQLRTKIHKDVRRIFKSVLQTTANSEGVITIFAGRHPQQQASGSQSSRFKDRNHERGLKGKLNWQELGGEFLHFSLYKENRDTMEVINFIARGTKTGPKRFSFAGTKDRRAVTVQRVSALKIHVEQLAYLNKTLQGAKLGDFKYEEHALELGDLQGNEFLITLRDCRFYGIGKVTQRRSLSLAEKIMANSVKNLQEHGFINYYGLQRFGSFGVGTDEVGLKILRDDFEGAVQAILTYSDEALAAALNPEHITKDQKPLPNEDKARAHAIYLFQISGSSQLALEKMPRKFHAEACIISHLGRHDRRHDFIGALMTINRNMRLMYLHAYQSLVWNVVASERWRRFGRNVVKGDLVLVAGSEDGGVSLLENEVDDDGEPIFVPGDHDLALSTDQYDHVRAVTAEDVANGKYSIFDVVLPSPGNDIDYPENEIGDFYKEFMASEKGGGLDPMKMGRKHRDFSLSGSYRKLLGKVGKEFSYQFKNYDDDNEQMVETDMEKILNPKPSVDGDKLGAPIQLDDENNDANKSNTNDAVASAVAPEPKVWRGRNVTRPDAKEEDWESDDEIILFRGRGPNYPFYKEEEEVNPKKIALILKFQLSASQYATMALRELMSGGVQIYQSDFSRAQQK